MHLTLCHAQKKTKFCCKTWTNQVIHCSWVSSINSYRNSNGNFSRNSFWNCYGNSSWDFIYEFLLGFLLRFIKKFLLRYLRKFLLKRFFQKFLLGFLQVLFTNLLLGFLQEFLLGLLQEFLLGLISWVSSRCSSSNFPEISPWMSTYIGRSATHRIALYLEPFLHDDVGWCLPIIFFF